MRRRRVIGGSCVLVGLLAAAAGALAQGTPYVAVVGPDAAGVRLEARAVHGQPCVRIADATGCGRLPGVDLDEPFVLEVQGSGRGGAAPLGGAVRAGIARVEYVLGDGRRLGADTVGAARLPGRAGRELRFFLLELPHGAVPVTRRLLDAGGGVVDERDDPLESGHEPAPLKGPVTLATGRRDGVRWTLSGELRDRLEPVRGDAGRRVSAVCVRSEDGPPASRTCQTAASDTSAFAVSGSCPQVTLLQGFVGRGTRVAVRLGDGRLRRVRTLALPPAFGAAGLRAYAYAVPRAAAVRSLRLSSARGRGTDMPLRLKPPELSCEPGLGTAVGLYGAASDGRPDGPFTGPATVLMPAGGSPLTVRDAGRSCAWPSGTAPTSATARR